MCKFKFACSMRACDYVSVLDVKNNAFCTRTKVL